MAYCFQLGDHLFILFYRIDDQKDKIRRVLKGRVPPDKDMKKEITKALRLGKPFLSCMVYKLEIYTFLLRHMGFSIKMV